jgi:hypothetical protein
MYALRSRLIAIFIYVILDPGSLDPFQVPLLDMCLVPSPGNLKVRIGTFTASVLDKALPFEIHEAANLYL